MKTLRKTMGLRTLDLFAGVGGIRLAFENVGFNTVFANDYDTSCKDTYDLNFKEPKLTVKDVWKIYVKKLPDFDVLLAGFPCQAFSIAGYHKGFKDRDNGGNLFFKIEQILNIKKPRAFMLENVKNLEGHNKGNTFKVIKNILEKKLKYHIKFKVLNEIELKKSFKEFVANEAHERYYYNDKPLYSKLKNDVNSEDTVYQWRRRYVRANKRGVVPTLTANMGTGGHNVPIVKNGKGIRKLTPKECFLLQGFPENFKLPNLADSKLYHQAGNSVTVSVIQRIAENIKEVLDGKRI